MEKEMNYDIAGILTGHDAQLNILTETIKELKREVKKVKYDVDESERDCSNYTDTLAEELDTARERLKKQSALVDLLLESNQRLKDDIYILKQKVSANEKDISYLETIIEDNI